MAQQSVPLGTWDEDPDGASILLATGRARHDLLVIAEPAFLRDLDQVWGRPSARVRLSFLPGVHAPSAPGQEDALMSYERGGLGVLVARGRTSLYEGESVRSTTALARIASGARLRAALLVTRATPLRGSGDVAGGAAPGQVRVVSDHLNLSGGPLFQATGMVSASWDANLTERLGRLRGVSGSAGAALAPRPHTLYIIIGTREGARPRGLPCVLPRDWRSKRCGGKRKCKGGKGERKGGKKV